MSYWQQSNNEWNWDLGIACGACTRECAHGPQMNNIGFGPDGGGSRVVEACNARCARNIRAVEPRMWVTCPEDRADAIPPQPNTVEAVILPPDTSRIPLKVYEPPVDNAA